MTKRFALCFAALCLASVMAMPIEAQSFSLRANIPFAFMVEGKSMPAGEYMVERQTADAPGGPLIFKNEVSGDGSFALPILIGGGFTITHNQPELIFRHYGDRYFLDQVWDGYSPTGFEIRPSLDERRAAKEKAAIQPENVVVATR